MLDATTCILLTMGELERLVEVKALILPLPDEANPVLILLFVQLMLLPVKFEPEKIILEIIVPAQTSWESIGNSEGVGFTTIWKV